MDTFEELKPLPNQGKVNYNLMIILSFFNIDSLINN